MKVPTVCKPITTGLCCTCIHTPNLGGSVDMLANQVPHNRERRLWCCAVQMASALKHCHDIGLAHLDIKPDNIYRARPQVDISTVTSKLNAVGSCCGSAVQYNSNREHHSCRFLQTQVPLVQAPSSTVSSVFGLGSGNMLSSSQPLAGVTSQPSTGSSSIGTTVYKLGDFGLAISKHAPGPAMEGDARWVPYPWLWVSVMHVTHPGKPYNNVGMIHQLALLSSSGVAGTLLPSYSQAEGAMWGWTRQTCLPLEPPCTS
jgi:serine/threonine protein kinase